MDLSINERKFEIFLEIAQGLNKVFNISPIIFGSLGLYRKIGEFGRANDIDVLVPDELINKKWGELINFMEEFEFKLVNEKEHEFIKNNKIVAFGNELDLLNIAKINIKDLLLSEIKGTKFKELSARQYLLCYQSMLRDKYRQEKLGKNDRQKIKLIQEYIKKSGIKQSKFRPKLSMAIIRSKKFILRPYKKGDEASLRNSINNKKIYRNTLVIPYPYTSKHAKEWIEKNLKEGRKKKPTMVNFVIDIDCRVAGAVGFHKIEGYKAELGYWLAEKYWRQGIMTEAVKLATNFGFRKLKLKRIFATVFPFNKASMYVLEKNNYNFEGVLRKCYKKDNKFLDAHLYAKVK